MLFRSYSFRSVLPYIIFIVQFIYLIKNNDKKYLIINNKLFVLFSIFFILQIIGLINSYFTNKFIFFELIRTPAIHYFISSFAYIFLIFNIKNNLQIISKFILLQIIILTSILILFIYNSQDISYGQINIKIEIPILNYQEILIANSNGLGRISLIITIYFFLLSFFIKKNSLFCFLISIIFSIITFSYEGRLNILSTYLILIFILFKLNLNIKKKILTFFIFFFLTNFIYLIYMKDRKSTRLNSSHT